jgi:hypothetical protein
LLIQLTHILLLGPAREQIGELHRLVSSPDQLHRRPPSRVFRVPEVNRRLHRDSPFGVPANEAGAGRQVRVGRVVTDVRPPALPEPEALAAGIEQEES